MDFLNILVEIGARVPGLVAFDCFLGRGCYKLSLLKFEFELECSKPSDKGVS